MPSSIGLAHILQGFFRKVKYYEWRMRTIMHGEDNQEGVDAVDEDDPAHPEAKIIDMTLTAKDGKNHNNGSYQQ